MRFPDDRQLQELHTEVRTAIGPMTPSASRATGRVVCPRVLINGTLIRTITVAASFEPVADVTLDEVRVELIYPEDDTSDRSSATQPPDTPQPTYQDRGLLANADEFRMKLAALLRRSVSMNTGRRST